MTQPSGIPLTPTQLRIIRGRIANQTALAAELEVSRSWLAQLLAGAFNPSEENLRRLCDALDLDLDVRVVVRINQRQRKNEKQTKKPRANG